MIFKKKLWLCRLPFVNFFKNGPHFAKTAPILQFLRFRTKYFARRYLLYMSLMEYTQKIRKIGPTILFNPKKGVGPLWPPPQYLSFVRPPSTYRVKVGAEQIKTHHAKLTSLPPVFSCISQ